MNESGKVVALIVIAATINASYQIGNKRDAAPSLFANGALIVVLVILGALWRWDIATAMAGLYLLGTAVTRGLPAITKWSATFSALAEGVK